MLLTKKHTWGDYDVDDDGNEIEREYHSYSDVVVPGCCEASTKKFTITLGFKEGEMYDGYDPDNKPVWVAHSNYRLEDDILGMRREYVGLDAPYKERWPVYYPEFCPFCGQKLPEIRKRANPPDAVWNGDDDYCDTCGERNMGCTCHHPTVLWEVVPPEESNEDGSDS